MIGCVLQAVQIGEAAKLVEILFERPDCFYGLFPYLNLKYAKIEDNMSEDSGTLQQRIKTNNKLAFNACYWNYNRVPS